MLSLERISKSYPRGVRRIDALCDVSLELAAGEFVAIHGGVRSGKTTLLRIAAGLEAPNSGRVHYRGTDLAEMSDRERARYMRSEVGCAWRPGPGAGNLSVLDYVAIPLFADRDGRRHALRRAYQALERAGIEPCREQRLVELSDTERRRVELAQALVRQPNILLADEPVSGGDLNIVEADQILELLQSVARDTGAAVMVTSAELSGAMRASRIMGLDRGRLIAARPARGGEIVEFPKSSQPRRRTL